MCQARPATFIGRMRRSRRHGVIVDPLFASPRGLSHPIKLPGDQPGLGAVVQVAYGPDGVGAQLVPLAWELLAPGGSAMARLYDIIDRHKVHPSYPPEVLAEVHAIEMSPGIDDPSLDDMTAIPFVTIDYASSLDLDQALHVARGPGGKGFVVRYALADASHFVPPSSMLFAEALGRGSSYYLPALTVPMLPAALSEGIVSLNAGVPRRSLMFTMVLDEDAGTVATTVTRARILSRAKLTYDGVQALHDGDPASPLRGQPYTESLLLLGEVGVRLMEAAKARDAIKFDRIEPRITIDATDPSRFAVKRERSNDVSRWNEQISLLCNMEGARIMMEGAASSDDVQPVFKTHAPPPAEAKAGLELLLGGFAHRHGLDPAIWTWHRSAGESMAHFLERLPVADETEHLRQAIERQVLVTSSRSMFVDEPGLHFALGVTPYGRFSAPMREIVGIFTHKELFEELGLAPPSPRDADEVLREKVLDAANRSKDRQRQLTKDVERLAVDDLLSRDANLPEHHRPQRPGTVIGVKATRAYVLMDDHPVELKVFTDDLAEATGRPWRTSDDGVALHPEGSPSSAGIALGDKVSLEVVGNGPVHRRWRLLPTTVLRSRSP